MQKNKTRLLVLVVLLLANVGFMMFADSGAGVSFDENLFVVKDTAGISTVTIHQEQTSIKMHKQNGSWILNEQYAADEALVRVLLSILNRVQVKKPAEVTPQSPIDVEITGDHPMSFSVWGNLTKTKTYFSRKGTDAAYEVVIPGYHEFVGGIFELHADQWRDRLVMNESWRTIQSLRLEYAGQAAEDLIIRFEKDFYRVAHLSAIDSTAVIDYLNQFQYFEANEWISAGRLPVYDSLAKKPPLVTLKIESINSEFPVILDIYPHLEGDSFHLMTDRENAMLVVDRQRVLRLLKEPGDFSGEDNLTQE